MSVWPPLWVLQLLLSPDLTNALTKVHLAGRAGYTEERALAWCQLVRFLAMLMSAFHTFLFIYLFSVAHTHQNTLQTATA